MTALTPPAPLSHPAYRPDIDGLRALAVLSVVAFHAVPHRWPGGFIGVDIFFVISGHLISKILFENLERGSFSFAEFYARRIRRIFPALLLVMACALAFGWFALTEAEYLQLGKHVAGGAGFVANIVLWNETGYFDNLPEVKPLLHLWSLGVEEQYYIAWPALVWLAWRLRARPVLLVLLAGGASFALNAAGVGSDRVGSFYSPQTRAWELLCGSLTAWFSRPGLQHPASSRRGLRWQGPAALAGVSMLAAGFAWVNSERAFPGYWALLPVGGTALLLLSGTKSWLGRRLLSARPAVWFGRISYPLYLWHWPLLSFARIVEGTIPQLKVRVGAVLAAVLLAALTQRFVETPLRAPSQGRRKAVGLLLAMAACGGLGALVWRLDGLPERASLAAFDPNHRSVLRLAEDDPASHARCLQRYGLQGPIRFCDLSGPGRPRVAVIGDSHARALYEGLKDVMSARGQPLLNIGGRLFLDLAVYPAGDAAEQVVYQGGIRATAFVADEPSIDTVIMVSRGAHYLRGEQVFHLISQPEVTDRRQIWQTAMRQTLDRMLARGKRVIFVLDNPELSFDPHECIAARPFSLHAHAVRTSCTMPRRDVDAAQAAYREAVLSVLKDYPQVTPFDTTPLLCDEQACRAMADGRLLYGDWDHLSAAGARLLAPSLVGLIDAGAPPAARR